MSILDHVVSVQRSDGSQQMARICPLYGRDDQGVVKVTWISDGAVVGKFVPFNELYIVELNIVNQSYWYRDIQKVLVNLAYTIIVVIATVYCLDVLVKWFRKNEVVIKFVKILIIKSKCVSLFFYFRIMLNA